MPLPAQGPRSSIIGGEVAWTFGADVEAVNMETFSAIGDAARLQLVIECLFAAVNQHVDVALVFCNGLVR